MPVIGLFCGNIAIANLDIGEIFQRRIRDGKTKRVVVFEVGSPLLLYAVNMLEKVNCTTILSYKFPSSPVKATETAEVINVLAVTAVCIWTYACILVENLSEIKNTSNRTIKSLSEPLGL
jgi:hypothetical protein